MEIIGVFASVFDGKRGFPTKLLPCFVDISEVLVYVARTARHDLIWDLDAIGLFKGVDKLKNGSALAGSEVIDDEAWVALQAFEGSDMAFGQIDDVDVVSDAGSIDGLVIVSEDTEEREFANRNLSDVWHEVVWEAVWIFAKKT